jgi:outer membrane protein TolC
MKSKYPLMSLLFLPLLVWAGPPESPADLPPFESVARVFEAHPSVRAAQASLRGAEAEHRRLQAGEHEFELSLTGQRRQVSGAPDFNEWEVGLARGLRLPGKGELDDQIGAQGVQLHREKIGDARHELARELLAAWYGARRAMVEAALWRDQVGVLTEQRRIVEQRVKRGDAARLDLLQTDAALAQARSQLGLAEARERGSLAELQARYPEFPSPQPSQVEAALPTGDDAQWIAHTLEHNHELLAIQRALEKGQLVMRRAEADFMPDPALGVFYAHEGDGQEKVLGLSLAIALPGQGRSAAADMARAEAEGLAEEEAATIRRLRAEAAANWQRANAAVESHAQLKAASAAVEEHADLARRAYELGELGLSESLLARRSAIESRLVTEQARLTANEAIARLLLDAHQLWPLAHEEGHH